MRSSVLRYGAALLAVFAAVMARMILAPALGTDLPFPPFYIAAFVVAWFAGSGPGLVALVLGFFAASVFLLNAELSSVDPLHTFIRSLLYFVLGVAAIFVIARQRNLQAKTEHHVEALKQEMQQRAVSTQALQAVQDHLAMMIENANDYAIFSLDARGTITMWNSGAERMFGYEESEILGKPFDMLFIPEDREAHVPEHELGRAAEVGVSQNERWHVLKNQERFFASGMTRSMRDASGKLVGFIKVARDETQRVLADQERIDLLNREQAARAAAEEANRAKLQFVAMLAHELRNPLASIKGFASTLLAKDVQFTPDMQREFIEIIDQETDKLNELIDQLLDISRLQAGALRVTTQPVSIDAILDSAKTQIRRTTANHQFKADVMPDLPMVMADRERTAQILVNLVQNAAKFSPPASEIRLSVHRDGGFIQFDVVDQGIGIPQEQRQAVFEAFRQVGQTEQTKKGAGLGLPIVKGLVEVQQGQIWIEDRDTPGTTMSFTLPVAEPTAT